MSSPDAIRRWLLRAGVPLRTKSRHHGHPSIPRFGRRVIKDKEVEFKAEQRVVQIIVGMKNEGLGLRAIARCLNQMRVPTKLRGRAWHPEMVRRILEHCLPSA